MFAQCMTESSTKKKSSSVPTECAIQVGAFCYAGQQDEPGSQTVVRQRLIVPAMRRLLQPLESGISRALHCMAEIMATPTPSYSPILQARHGDTPNHAISH